MTIEEFEKWIRKNIAFEDPEGYILIGVTEDNKIMFLDYEGDIMVDGNTIGECCEKWDHNMDEVSCNCPHCGEKVIYFKYAYSGTLYCKKCNKSFKKPSND